MEHVSNEEKIQELLNEPCWNSKPYLIGMDRLGVEDVMERFAEWKDEQFEKEKKEIDEQWKRLMAESKSIGVDLLQGKDEVHAKEKQEWIDKVGEWINDNYFEYLQPISYHEQLQNSIDINDFVNDLKKAMEEKL